MEPVTINKGQVVTLHFPYEGAVFGGKAEFTGKKVKSDDNTFYQFIRVQSKDESKNGTSYIYDMAKIKSLMGGDWEEVDSITLS